jgi:elongation factor 1-alpha
LTILDKYRVGGIGTVICGRVVTGTLKAGTKVMFAPSNNPALEVKSVERHNQSIKIAVPGDIIGFNMIDW